MAGQGPYIARPWNGGPVEFDRVVPPSGNMEVRGKQFWLGPARSGVTVTFWADTDVIHLLIGMARVKSVRSHLSVADLEILAHDGGRRAGPSPLPPPVTGGVVEVDRTVNRTGRCRWASASSWLRTSSAGAGSASGSRSTR